MNDMNEKRYWRIINDTYWSCWWHTRVTWLTHKSYASQEILIHHQLHELTHTCDMIFIYERYEWQEIPAHHQRHVLILLMTHTCDITHTHESYESQAILIHHQLHVLTHACDMTHTYESQEILTHHQRHVLIVSGRTRVIYRTHINHTNHRRYRHIINYMSWHTRVTWLTQTHTYESQVIQTHAQSHVHPNVISSFSYLNRW